MKEYLEVKLAVIDERLRQCSPEELGGLQGQSAGFQEVMEILSVAPPKID